MDQGQGQLHPAFVQVKVTDGKDDTPEAKYNTRFKQQTLRHLRLNVNAAGFASLAIIIGTLFIPTGIFLLYSTNQAQELVLDYTNCQPATAKATHCGPVSTNLKKPLQCCSVQFQLPSNFKGKVYVYYGLSKFHQNHRLFAKSRDEQQLYGGTGTPSQDCKPFDLEKSDPKGTEGPKGRPIWPCGALPNAMFQDRFRIYAVESDGGAEREIKIQRTGIAWRSDVDYKFKNPSGWNTPEFQKKHAPPPNWRILPWDLDNGLQNEDFVVWMRIAALPDFRKVYGTMNDMPKGKYRLEIEHDFEVKSFKGTKSVVIATKAILGGKNPTLGFMYIGLGVTFLITGIIFLYIHLDSTVNISL